MTWIAVQEVAKYGRKSGVDFGPIDYVKYAEAFGAVGLMIRTADEIAPVLRKALDTPGPVLVGIHVDYTDNHTLFEMVHENSIHQAFFLLIPNSSLPANCQCAML
jgi:acetolactate synthase I/II/III large subunit